MIQAFSTLHTLLETQKPVGCFADTTILFSATYPSDQFNEESETAFETLAKLSVPTFVSVNVRAEFLENHRRVFIADSLIDFLDDMDADLEGPLRQKLESHRTSHRRKVLEEKNTKLDVNQIKMFRSLLSSFQRGNLNGWEVLCRNYLKHQLIPLWSDVRNELDLNFISTRSEDRSPFLNELPSWERAVEIMGDYGLASADAMILNMFLCSTIPVLLTADLEMAEVAEKEANGSKHILVPDSAMTAHG